MIWSKSAILTVIKITSYWYIKLLYLALNLTNVSNMFLAERITKLQKCILYIVYNMLYQIYSCQIYFVWQGLNVWSWDKKKYKDLKISSKIFYLVLLYWYPCNAIIKLKKEPVMTWINLSARKTPDEARSRQYFRIPPWNI